MKCVFCDGPIRADSAIVWGHPVCEDCVVSTTMAIPNGKERWDRFFLNLCIAAASNSKCHSRKIGAVITRGKDIVTIGYNGPPRGYHHCVGPPCPRRRMGYESGEGLQHCPAVHAEVNAIIVASRNGVSTAGCTLYLNTCYPCKDCMAVILQAGIAEVVALKHEFYDELAPKLAAPIKLRVFSCLSGNDSSTG